MSSPWDWRERFSVEDFEVAPASVGQPRVDWRFACLDSDTGTIVPVEGHVEIRWSHGRFVQPPEAKVYLDTPMARLPGYHPLTDEGGPQLALWPAAE